MQKKLASLWLILIAIVATSATCAAPSTKSAMRDDDKPSASARADAPSTAPNFWDQMSAPPDPTAAPVPQWIWGKDDATPGETRFFRTTFDANIPTTYMTENPSAAWIWCAGDDEITVYLNGKQVARTGAWQR